MSDGKAVLTCGRHEDDDVELEIFTKYPFANNHRKMLSSCIASGTNDAEKRSVPASECDLYPVDVFRLLSTVTYVKGPQSVHHFTARARSDSFHLITTRQ